MDIKLDSKKKKIIKSFFLVFAFVLFVFFLINQPSKIFKPEDIKSIKIAGQDVRVELALTLAEQMQGLSGRNKLNENEGMLFVFKDPGIYSFWMKDMSFPIDMIWISENMKVIYIKKNALPGSYPEAYKPLTDSKYVLEIASGFSDKNNLKVGDGVVFGK